MGNGAECISEVGLENAPNKEGLRYKMNKTPEEAVVCEPLFGLPSITLNLPIIGETYLGPPRDKESIWEALGFTATSNNNAGQTEKVKVISKAQNSKVGVMRCDGAALRAKWLEKYGYPCLVGSGGIFYADQQELYLTMYLSCVDSLTFNSYDHTGFRRTSRPWVVSTWASRGPSGLFRIM